MRDDADALIAALGEASQDAREAIMSALSDASGAVADAMLYATEGGKALRALLVLEGARVHGVDRRHAVPAAAAIECIHAYSLVHDDMPAMDDDDLRRGRPTVHRKWDEGTALLTGDALQSLAFELVGEGAEVPAERRLSLSRSLARAAGIRGMVDGQARDIAAETAATPLTLDQIVALQKRKTGALIEWAATAGARLAGADTGPLATFGAALGLSFQIADDLLDVTASTEEMGKKTGKDAGRGKATFVTLMGVDGARARAEALCDEAIAALSCYGESADLLRSAARFAVSRRS